MESCGINLLTRISLLINCRWLLFKIFIVIVFSHLQGMRDHLVQNNSQLEGSKNLVCIVLHSSRSGLCVCVCVCVCVIILQYCIGFQCATKWFSYVGVCMCVCMYILFQISPNKGYYMLLSIVPWAIQEVFVVYLVSIQLCMLISNS